MGRSSGMNGVLGPQHPGRRPPVRGSVRIGSPAPLSRGCRLAGRDAPQVRRRALRRLQGRCRVSKVPGRSWDGRCPRRGRFRANRAAMQIGMHQVSAKTVEWFGITILPQSRPLARVRRGSRPDRAGDRTCPAACGDVRRSRGRLPKAVRSAAGPEAADGKALSPQDRARQKGATCGEKPSLPGW